MNLNELRRLAGLNEAVEPVNSLASIAQTIYQRVEKDVYDQAAEYDVGVSGDMIENEAKKVLQEIAKEVLRLVQANQSV